MWYNQLNIDSKYPGIITGYVLRRYPKLSEMVYIYIQRELSRIYPKSPEAHSHLPEVIRSKINALSEVIRNGLYRVESCPELIRSYPKLTVIYPKSSKVQSTHYPKSSEMVYRVELFRIDPKLPEAYLKLTVISEVTFLSPEVQSTHFG